VLPEPLELPEPAAPVLPEPLEEVLPLLPVVVLLLEVVVEPVLVLLVELLLVELLLVELLLVDPVEVLLLEVLEEVLLLEELVLLVDGPPLLELLVDVPVALPDEPLLPLLPEPLLPHAASAARAAQQMITRFMVLPECMGPCTTPDAGRGRRFQIHRVNPGTFVPAGLIVL